MNNTEVVTTQDKDARDRMYADLRRGGNKFERQVVRFSDCEYISKIGWRQVWSLAYPRS